MSLARLPVPCVTANLFFAVPVNLKEQDAFHLTIEEYLLALISMVEELVRPLVLFRSCLSLTIFSRAWLSTRSL